MNRALLICMLAMTGFTGCGMRVEPALEDPGPMIFTPPQSTPEMADSTTMIYYCSLCGECTPEFVNYKSCTKRLPDCANGCTVTYRCQRTLDLFDISRGKCVEIIWIDYWSR